jgi:glycosyltransferase involved in cell wall biosynthesis
MTKLSLVLPCYNPPANWERNIISVFNDFCRKTGTVAELIVVLDGNSALVTGQTLETLRQHIPDIKILQYAVNRGKGYAIRQGAAVAGGGIIMYTDIDFPYTVASMERVYNALANGSCHVAVGVKDEGYYRHLPPVRRQISRYLRWMTGAFLNMPITDTQCGLKGFNAVVKPLFLATTINRYLFDLEFIRNCFAAGKYTVTPIPVTLNENVQFRSMNYSILLPEMLNFIKLLFKKTDA